MIPPLTFSLRLLLLLLGPFARSRWTGLALALCCGCSALVPSNDRDWAPELAQLATADFNGDFVTIHNIRNAEHTTHDESQMKLRYYDQTYDLRRLQSIDLIVVPFAEFPDLAHVMTSYGFADGKYVAISVEVRRESDEVFNPINAFFNQYELQYVVGDERDLINLRTTTRLVDVYLYHIQAAPEQARAMFTAMLKRANTLAAEPEFYNTVTNNCTTNVVRHVNELKPNLIRFGTEVLLPGHSPRLAYDLGLIDKSKSFEETEAAARINELAYKHRNDPDFSRKIRGK